MKINNHFNSPYRSTNSYASQNNANSNNPSFKGLSPKNIEKLRNLFSVDSTNGSLSRIMFFIVGTVFMLGGRFFESRSNDEKREVVTRDIPAVALSCGGAPLINQAVAYGITKASGIPIVTNGKKFSFKNTGFTSQSQLKNWYSKWSENPNALIDFSDTIERNGGKLTKVMKKLGLGKQLEAITKETENGKILDAIKNAQGTDAFKALESGIKNMSTDNKVLKFAKNAQAAVKVGGIAFMAALLGYFLPHLNIITTKKKYQGKVDDATLQKKLMRTSPVFRVSSGVLSFHKASAVKTFQSLLNMVEHSSESAEKFN
ncbi:MAG: hypothetical protein KHX03_02965 [Clostridium sp.]|nr:hypothetical protein [Clostridium sp.]